MVSGRDADAFYRLFQDGRVIVMRSEGGDEHTVAVGAGNDHIVGGPGSDLLSGGDGADVVDARDGEPDVVDGGDGTDTALVDRSDRVVNVEHVLRPEPRNLA
jgi:Ca2+-binding RTX toxin-like protein